MLRSQMIGAVSVAVSILISPPAEAQWPNKTVKIVVPFAPGGSADVLMRSVGQHISQGKGQSFVIENRPGGGTVIATEYVSRAEPDGATVLLVGNSFVINSILRSSLSYDPFTSFEPVCVMVNFPLVLAVNNASPIRTFAEFLATAKAVPPTLSIAAVGPASSNHLALEMLKHAAKIEFNYVPFPGGAPVVTTLLGGHVSAALANYVDVQENLGINLRALVVGAVQRLPALKDVPTLAEAGFGDIIAATWFGLMVPAKTGKEVVGQMATLFKAALEDADVKAKLSASGLTPVGMCGAEFEQHLKAQHAAYARIIKEANVKG